MSMCAPSYYSDEEFQKWYDFKNNRFKEGAPIELIERVKAEDEEREREIEEARKEGCML